MLRRQHAVFPVPPLSEFRILVLIALSLQSWQKKGEDNIFLPEDSQWLANVVSLSSLDFGSAAA